ncbi:type VII toxin-antitoxin system MntA family adenylyltransferase antitoxin [Lentibacillus salicampi]|uniref:Nucleotidyltransferase domain-containing protein n=1 Tax=Lentibacillus salicampi TaxID=175306 RepID=A0A4Y9AC57_9BACI|nr:nucleotidyltransferase domain-containing protein [Lentibacillus salicampi]TFJ93393.1 nucleotidyltransferase domain-containing protein [Lentibacillus salicampi]
MHDGKIEIAKDFLVPKLDPVFLILFGSQAKGTEHRESDIDLAFYCKNNAPSAYETFMLAQELAAELNMDVDLVNIREATTVFQAQIFSTGRVIYSKDDILRAKVQMTVMSMYARLNEERQVILDKIRERGSIYDE